MASEALVVLLLRLSRDPAQFRAALARHGLGEVTVMLASGDDVPGDSSHGRALAGQEPFDAAVFVRGPDAAGALDRLAPRLAGMIDATRSAAVAGTVHGITEGSERSLLVFALRRRPEMTLAESTTIGSTIMPGQGSRSRRGGLRRRGAVQVCRV